ncbi:MAG TPA: BTAD domain-containing putative transcriptional regulator [Mycobacteriales bacterium]|nr:BTAD domain-containing putative transcriptional regulator [Mycobacteriales bacterium]
MLAWLRRLLRALLSLAGLTALAGGVPVALWRVAGWPLPHRVPAWAALRRGLTEPVDDRVLLNVIVVVTWLAWAYLLVTILVEIAAAVAPRRVRWHVPGPGAVIARRLISGLLAASAAVPVVALPASAAAPPARPPAATSVLNAAAPTAGPSTGAAARPDTYTVRPGDTLWGIAAHELGPTSSPAQVAARWPRWYAANRGRPQPAGGGALTDPNRLLPGWQLRDPDTPAPHHTPPARATRRRTTPPPSPAPAPAPHRPAARHTPPPAARPEQPSTPADAAPTRHSGRPDDQPANRSAIPAALVPIGGSALFAAAVVSTLTRARRRRGAPALPAPQAAARLETLLRVAAEPDDLTDLLRALDLLAARLADTTIDVPPILGARLRPTAVDLLLAATRTDAPAPFRPLDGGRVWTVRRTQLPAVRDDATPCPLPTLVPVGRDTDGLVLLHLEHAGAVAVTGTPDARRRLLTSIAAELAVAPWPTWVDVTTLGLPRDLTRLDPERLHPATTLDEPTLRTLTAADTPTSTDPEAPAAARIRAPWQDRPAPRVLLAATPLPEAALAALGEHATRPGSTLTALTAGEWPHARWTFHIDDDGTLTVPELGLRLHAVTVTTTRLPQLAELLENARAATTDDDDEDPRAPAAATSTPADDAGQAPPDPAAVDPDPQPAPPQTSPADSARIDANPTPAATTTAAPAATVTDPTPAAGHAVDGTAALALADPGDDLDRAVAAYLTAAPGTVQVRGFAGPAVTAPGTIESRRVATLTELVLLLAANPTGLYPTDIAAALWPDRTVSSQTISATLCRARGWLGTATDGTPHLPPAGAGRVRLSPTVLVDWQLFTALVDRARRHPDRAPADLTTALHLINGGFLTDRPDGRYHWLTDTDLEHTLPAAVLDAAHQLARHHLDTGNPAAARDTARIAHRVDDCDERPWRDLMEAEAALGHPQRVAQLRDQLIRHLDYEVEEDLTPETVQLLDRLLPRGQAGA